MSVKIQPHENFERIEDVKPSSERSFGLVMVAFFRIVAIFPLVSGSSQPPD
jgi:hypothetical protein